MSARFFGAFDALAIDDTSRRTGLSFGQILGFDIKFVMDAIKRAVPLPAPEVIVDRAAHRQILGDCLPLAAGAEDEHQPVDDLPHAYRLLIATRLAWRNQGLSQRLLGVCQVAWIAQPAAIMESTVFVRPDRRPPTKQAACIESQVTLTTQ